MIKLDKDYIRCLIEKAPNRRETWLDVQARALYQADLLITSAIRDVAYQYFDK